jgi:GDP-mannose 4,6-dehydratase
MKNVLENCRICNCTILKEVIDLGNQIITSRFPLKGDITTPSTRIRLVMCDQCRLVQLKDTTHSSELYEHLYGYRSGISNTMREHLLEYNQQIKDMIFLTEGDYVLDIGSNDSTFLGYYPSSLHRVGCDPTGSQFIEYYQDDMKLVPTYFTKQVINDTFGENVRFKVVSSISMFYDLPQPVQFAKDIYEILDPNGIWTLEQSYVLTMLERNSVDTICHEHLEYYGVKQIKEIMDRSGFKIIHLSKNECNGGSFRIYVCKQENTQFTECTALITEYLTEEDNKKIHTYERYDKFYEDCLIQVNILKTFIKHLNADNKKVYVYGASTKGNCLLQFAGINSTYIPYAVERNPLKYGRTTSTGIEIISEEQMRNDYPDYLLVLPWHFRNEIIQRESDFFNRGGTFIFPFPHFELYSSKPRCVITGIDGQIAHYVVEQLKHKYQLYGITKKLLKNEQSVIKIVDTLDDYKRLENILLTIKPLYIIHLASISNTEECEKHPIQTITTNGMSVAYLCEIIRNNNLSSSLFNASSSENFKGHINYNIKEDDLHFQPTTLYGISKTFGHQIVSHYREKYNLPLSNGIIFTTESPERTDKFLLKRIANHAAQFFNSYNVLTIGSIDSYRNIIHAKDVASAIDLILYQKNGDTYIIGNLESIHLESIVKRIYKHFNIELTTNDNINYYDSITGKNVLFVGQSLRGCSTNINGYPEKLESLGWRPEYSIDKIIEDLSSNI